MSNAIKVKKDTKKQKAAISQSIPAHFYKNYIPPKTPQINPIQPTQAIPDFDQLPKISPTGKGINIKKTGSYSLTQNRHPMSMPVRHGMMGPSATPFTVNPPNKDKKDDETESKEPNSLEQKNKQLKVGSFTCFDIMTSPLKQLPEAPDQKDNASATSQQTTSTFASSTFEEDEVAPDDEEDDAGEGGGFDIEL